MPHSSDGVHVERHAIVLHISALNYDSDMILISSLQPCDLLGHAGHAGQWEYIGAQISCMWGNAIYFINR